MPARNFKTDASFLEKLAMGAIGTRRVFFDLEAQGHKPLELERGSMSFKLWKAIKIKRARVPDLICLGCGQRIESRAGRATRCRARTSPLAACPRCKPPTRARP